MVVIILPVVGQDAAFPKIGEDFGVKNFVTQAAVEALGVSVLPGRAGLDVQRLHAGAAQKLTNGLGDELRPIVRTEYA